VISRRPARNPCPRALRRLCVPPAASEPPASPPLPRPPTIELQPGALLISGKQTAAPDGSRQFWASEDVRRVMKQALEEQVGRAPRILVMPTVSYDTLLGAFTAVTWQLGEFDGGLATPACSYLQ